MPRGTYVSDQLWARRYEAETIRVLAPYMSILLADVYTVQHAGTAEDRACIGDLRIDVGSIHILSRVRECHQRDLTLRSWRANNVDTEVKKILSGAGKWYFYGWAEPKKIAFEEWMLIDLDIVRKRETIQHYMHKTTFNTDDTTAFVVIPRSSLEGDGAIRVQQKRINGEVTMLKDSGIRYTAEQCNEWLAEHGFTNEETGVVTASRF
jgi:hypothetical protein